jgi:hypothetical protein
MIFAYFSPEMTLPLATFLTAIVGFITLVGRAPFRLAARGWRYLAEKLHR